MSLDPGLLRLLAGSAAVAAQHAEHVQELIKHFAKGLAHEDAEVMQRRALQMARAAFMGRETAGLFEAMADLADRRETPTEG